MRIAPVRSTRLPKIRQEVKRRENDKPNRVDKMPIDRPDGERRMAFFGKISERSPDEQEREHHQTGHHMGEMKSRHREVDRVENRGRGELVVLEVGAND